MNKYDTIQDLIRAEQNPTFLVYFLRKHETRYTSLEHCKGLMLSHLKTVNDYDPMQLHGVKTLDELQAMVDSHAPREFLDDQNAKFQVDMAPIARSENEAWQAVVDEVEKSPDFVRWVNVAD